MHQLTDEFLAAMDGLHERDGDWLIRQGVPEISIHMWPGPLGGASIETYPPACFDFGEGSRRAIIHPVLSGPAFSDIVDLVAWYPDEPDQWWTSCYRGIPLGIDQLDLAEIEGKPLLLHPTPLDWLRAGGDGACILDWNMPALSLRCVPVLLVENAEFGRYVDNRLSRPPSAVPEIRVLIGETA